MELINHTPFPAGIFRTSIKGGERIAASVLARITFDIVDGTLRPSQEQPWIVSGPPWDSPQGPMDSDELFYKGGVDLFLFGHARPPAGQSVMGMPLRIAVGAWGRTLLVIGDRVWEKSGRRLIPSPPQPFQEMPLTLARAFGGADEWDGLRVEFPDNPAGRGYFIEKDHAVGGPLPNLEDPEAPIAEWTDRPDPVGLGPCPMQSSMRLRNGIKFDDQGAIEEIRPTLFNAAFPRMVLGCVRAGDAVRVEGVRVEGPVEFRIPDAAPIVRLTFDDEEILRELAIDQIGIEADQDRAFIAYRYPFRYVIYPLQRRSCELFPWDAGNGGDPRP